MAEPSPPTPLPATPEEARGVDLVLWPDPRLRAVSTPIKTFDGHTTAVLQALAERMFEVMREHKGVGLAAPQVGVNVRLFVMNAGDDEPFGGDRVIVNPVLHDPDGAEEDEEGCLSLPKVKTPVLRSTTLRLTGKTPAGEEIEATAEGFVTRVWQHEIDHLDGVLLIDKMPPTVRMANKKILKGLQEDYARAGQ